MNDINLALKYDVYLISLVHVLIEYGYDPRNALVTTLRTIQHSNGQSVDFEIFDFMLISMSQIIHNITPFYLGAAVEVTKVSRADCVLIAIFELQILIRFPL